MSMEHLTSRTRKAACTLAAAALALSCWPLSAFAADADVSYGDGSNTTKVGIRLTAPQINVQAPVRITFGDAQAIDISTSSGVSSSSSVKFVNRTQEKVYLAAADVVQTSTANIGSVFDVSKMSSNAKLTFSSSKTASGQTCTMQCDITNASTTTPTAFAFSGTSNAQRKAFAIEAASSPSAEVAMAIDLMLSFPMSIMKSATALGAADKLEGRCTSICGIVWTFAIAIGNGNTGDDFFLEINDDATNGDLVKYRGAVFSLEDVVMMADNIAKNGNGSKYYSMFNAMITDVDKTRNHDASSYAAGQYTCQVRWGGTTYDVRVIGVNHDDLTTPTDGRTKAGLTFQFVNQLNENYSVNNLNTSSGGWGASELRTTMNSGTIWSNIPSDQQQAFKTVSKPYSSTDSGAGTQAYSNDKVFLASYWELGGSLYSSWSSHTYLSTKEGTQYDYWKNKDVTGDNIIQSVLVKGWQKSPTDANRWWERSVRPGNSGGFTFVTMGGTLMFAGGASTLLGVCPCFCL